jgi:hypothetical protein
MGPWAKTATVSPIWTCALCRRDSGRSDIRQQHNLLITQVVRNFREVGLCIRNQQVFGLRAIDRVSEFPAADRPATLRPFATQAVVALPAGRDRTNQHALADGVTRHADAQFVNDADGFMTNDEARFYGILALENMQVRAADRRQRHADHGFARSWFRNGHLFNLDLVGPVEHESFHRGRNGVFLWNRNLKG